MKECQNCGTSVSSKFGRVFGDNDDKVYACPECSSRGRGIRERLVAGEDS